MSLLDLYTGAALGTAGAKQQGTVTQAYSTGRAAGAAVRRRNLLAQAVKTGALSPDSLGPLDQKLLKGSLGGLPSLSGLKTNLGDSGTAHGVLGFFHNLGNDVFNTGRYIVPGLFEAGKSAFEDIKHNPESLLSGPLAPVAAAIEGGGKSEVYKNIVKPMGAQYAYTYGGKGAPEGSSFLKRLYEHPLQPLLDAATVASLGAGGVAKAGSIASKIAPESAIGEAGANLDRAILGRQGRAPLHYEAGGEGRSIAIPRQYTPRPLSKLGQRGLDKLGERSDFIYRLQQKAGVKEFRSAKTEHDNRMALAHNDAVTDLHSIAKLSPVEARAMYLSHIGLNSDELLDRYESVVKDNTLSDEKKMTELDNLGVDHRFVSASAEVTPEVRALIRQPTEAMQEADAAWKLDRQRAEEQFGLEGDRVESHVNAIRDQLTPEGTTAGEEFPHALEPSYVPQALAVGFKPHEGNILARIVPKRLQDGLGIESSVSFRRGPTDRPGMIRPVDPQRMLADTTPGFLRHSTGETALSGAARHDSRLYFEQSIKERQAVEDQYFSHSQLNRWGVKDPEKGEYLRFKDEDEMRRELGPGFTLVNDKIPVRWIHAETNYLKRIQATIDKMRVDDPDLNEVDMEAVLNEFTDHDAQAFIKSNFQALKNPGIAIPTDVAKEMMSFFELDQPFKFAPLRFIARMMHRWRTLVLTYMPRWALNTALGSFVMAMAKGVLNPVDYAKGFQLQRRGELPEGVNLSHQTQQETLDLAAPGHGKPTDGASAAMSTAASQLGIRAPTQKLLKGVQAIEDTFRKGAFVKYLKREQQLRDRHMGGQAVTFHNADFPAVDPPFEGRYTDDQLQEMWNDPDNHEMSPEEHAQLSEYLGSVATPGEKADALGKFGDTQKTFWGRLLDTFGGNVEAALQDKEMVRNAIMETNKTSYTYSILGPYERRVVRQFIPFWGWYKFITMAAYRLPVEDPGKATLMRAISQIGQDDESKVGPMPEWAKGGLILGIHDGKLKYLPTLGMNPFSSFGNPLGPKGIAGVVDPGQLNPMIGAILQGIGHDPLTGGQVAVSPQAGVTTNQYGELINQQGQQVSPEQVEALPRTLMALFRSVPQFRLAEKYLVEGGGSVYPESIPLVRERPMAPGTSQDPGNDAALATVGLLAKTVDLKKYQSQTAKNARYAKHKIRRAKMKQERKTP